MIGIPVPIRLYSFLCLFLKVLSLVGSDVTYGCPGGLYDCESLEARLRSTADVFITPEFMASYHEDTYHVGELCRFFRSPECYEPVVRHCKGELKFASQAFRDRQRYICGDRVARKGRNPLKSCVDQYEGNLDTCKESRAQSLEELAYVGKSSAESQLWCSVTKDYITCVYSVFALGCTFEVADEYMASVNQSTPVVEAVYGYGCNFGHPLDILKTTTPVPETSPVGGLGDSIYSSGRHPNSGSSRSAASSLHHRFWRGSHGNARLPLGWSSVHGLLSSSWGFLNMPHKNSVFPADGVIVLSCCLLSLILQTFLARASDIQIYSYRDMMKSRKSGHLR